MGGKVYVIAAGYDEFLDFIGAQTATDQFIYVNRPSKLFAANDPILLFGAWVTRKDWTALRDELDRLQHLVPILVVADHPLDPAVPCVIEKNGVVV